MLKFFDQLQMFSERVFDLLRITESTSPWTSGSFRAGKPIGSILHFTSGFDPRRAIKWFMEKRYESNASAHVVIADGWPDLWIELASDLDLVKMLPSAVVQCVPPDQVAWHATWTNHNFYGIEIVNSGELRPLPNGDWSWWPGNFSEKWDPPRQKLPVNLFGKYWEPFSSDQILSAIAVLRNVQQECKTLQQRFILGHEHVVGSKYDPGPTFPIHGVRSAVFDQVSPIIYNWFEQFESDLKYGFSWREKLIQNWVKDVKGDSTIDTKLDSWNLFRNHMDENFIGENFGVTGKYVLALLGYYVENYTSVVTQAEIGSIEIFQAMTGLTADGIPGPATKTALRNRMKDRGFLLNM